MKLFIFALFSVLATQNVNAMKCYATDLKNLKKDSANIIVQDCKESVEQILSLESQSDVTLTSDKDVRCYKLAAVSGTLSLMVKGCIPAGRCYMVQDMYKAMLQVDTKTDTGKLDENLKCYECSGDLCNSSFRIYADPLVIAIFSLTFLCSTKIMM